MNAEPQMFGRRDVKKELGIVGDGSYQNRASDLPGQPPEGANFENGSLRLVTEHLGGGMLVSIVAPRRAFSLSDGEIADDWPRNSFSLPENADQAMLLRVAYQASGDGMHICAASFRPSDPKNLSAIFGNAASLTPVEPQLGNKIHGAITPLAREIVGESRSRFMADMVVSAKEKELRVKAGIGVPCLS